MTSIKYIGKATSRGILLWCSLCLGGPDIVLGAVITFLYSLCILELLLVVNSLHGF